MAIESLRFVTRAARQLRSALQTLLHLYQPASLPLVFSFYEVVVDVVPEVD